MIGTLLNMSAGLLHLKTQQDLLPPNEHYIRQVIEITDELDKHDEDEPEPEGHVGLRMVICMSMEGSQRLACAQYIQSDIGFKRIVDYYEFEMACVDRLNNTSNIHNILYNFILNYLRFAGVVFCRVYLNRQTAVAHCQIFQEIEKIVLLDTGKALQWRHLHACTADEAPAGMILQWTVDQHGGQAKGLFVICLSFAGVNITNIQPR